MKMRKLLALGLGIVFAIGAVAGCGNQAAEKPAKETAAKKTTARKAPAKKTKAE